MDVICQTQNFEAVAQCLCSFIDVLAYRSGLNESSLLVSQLLSARLDGLVEGCNLGSEADSAIPYVEELVNRCNKALMVRIADALDLSLPVCRIMGQRLQQLLGRSSSACILDGGKKSIEIVIFGGSMYDLPEDQLGH